ncbi:MAG: glutamate--tRNA ligase, partial [Gammaproteobacteria bacterium]|nr:glutamate--tRNA ligase [Gammaproteobacteria bacterium]
MKVRTRFAPSPTGYLHIGGARTALFCWLFARRHGGDFILRIEDTDRERSTPEAVQAILDGMQWLGLGHDEGPFYQTERFDRYKELVQKLLDEGKAYHCYCTKEELDERRAEQMKNKQKPRYDGRCRERTEPREGVEPVVRFRNPQDGAVVIKDHVRGTVTFNNTELDDLIIARSDGTPTYNFTVVVDDMDMNITHVVRGDDHLNNTPRQVNIFEALGATPPEFAHLPMILGPDGAKLSKRHGAVSVMEYRKDGFLPQAVRNYLVRLGWAHGDQEIFSTDEMIKLFDIADVNHSASAINPSKLEWLNQHYIKEGDLDALGAELGWHLGEMGIDVSAGPSLTAVVQANQERAKTFVEMAENSRFFFEDFTEYDEKAARKVLKPEAVEPLQKVRDGLAGLGEWQAEAIHNVVIATGEALDLKLGKVAQPIRVAVAGKGVSPPIDITLELLGKDKTLERIDTAIRHIAD